MVVFVKSWNTNLGVGQKDDTAHCPESLAILFLICLCHCSNQWQLYCNG